MLSLFPCWAGRAHGPDAGGVGGGDLARPGGTGGGARQSGPGVAPGGESSSRDRTGSLYWLYRCGAAFVSGRLLADMSRLPPPTSPPPRSSAAPEANGVTYAPAAGDPDLSTPLAGDILPAVAADPAGRLGTGFPYRGFDGSRCSENRFPAFPADARPPPEGLPVPTAAARERLRGVLVYTGRAWQGSLAGLRRRPARAAWWSSLGRPPYPQAPFAWRAATWPFVAGRSRTGARKSASTLHHPHGPDLRLPPTCPPVPGAGASRRACRPEGPGAGPAGRDGLARTPTLGWRKARRWSSLRAALRAVSLEV